MGLRASAPIGLALCGACGGAFSSNLEQHAPPSDAGRLDAAWVHSPSDATTGARSDPSDDGALRADAVAPDSSVGIAVLDADMTPSDADQSSDANGSIEASADAAAGCRKGCGAHEVCAYLVADACGAAGSCVVPPPPSTCNAIVLETACGCDGHAVHWDGGCKPALPNGYAPAPVTHMGACP
jgi:hypothetical protein